MYIIYFQTEHLAHTWTIELCNNIKKRDRKQHTDVSENNFHPYPNLIKFGSNCEAIVKST